MKLLKLSSFFALKEYLPQKLLNADGLPATFLTTRGLRSKCSTDPIITYVGAKVSVHFYYN
jgi:hypothetical protein